ncbi:MAG: N-acetylglucosamine-6-phosphate deacetylase [bacterium]
MKNRFVIRGGRIYTPLEAMEEGNILAVEDGTIEYVGPDSPKYEGWDSMDVGGRIVAPGFIDLHIHGFGEHNVMEVGGAREVARTLPKTGVTAFLPTTVTAPIGDLRRVLDDIRRSLGMQGEVEAQILGVNIEGPFINEEKKGAHQQAYIRQPRDEDFNFIEEYKDIIKIVTLAPEVPGCMELIDLLNRLGIVASIGHSNADYETAVRAIRRGVRYATHTYNAMSGMTGTRHNPQHPDRNPGVVGAVLTEDDVTAEIICDGVHSLPPAVKLFHRAKGTERAVLVTDRASPKGLGDRKIRDGGNAYYLEDGTLAGSSLTIDRAVRNIVEYAGAPLKDAIRMATLNPAGAIGVSPKKGFLAEGGDADIVILDENGNPYKTIVRGKMCDFKS